MSPFFSKIATIVASFIVVAVGIGAWRVRDFLSSLSDIMRLDGDRGISKLIEKSASVRNRRGTQRPRLTTRRRRKLLRVVHKNLELAAERGCTHICLPCRRFPDLDPVEQKNIVMAHDSRLTVKIIGPAGDETLYVSILAAVLDIEEAGSGRGVSSILEGDFREDLDTRTAANSPSAMPQLAAPRTPRRFRVINGGK